MTAVAITILIVPFQLFSQGFLQAKEKKIILPFQRSLDEDHPDCTIHGDFCNNMITWPTLIFSFNNTQYALYWFAMYSDSLLAFKTALLTVIGMYMLVFLQISFRDGRPFWD